MNHLQFSISFYFVFVVNSVVSAQISSDKRTFERIFNKMESQLKRNYNTPNEQNIVFYEYVFDKQKNIRFAARIDEFITTDPWFTFTINAEKKGIRDYLCFSAETYNLDSLKYWGRHNRGALIGGCPYHTGFTTEPISTLAARIEYENDARNSPKKDLVTQNLPTAINKAFYTQTPIDSVFFVIDTVWKSEACFLLTLFQQKRFEITLEDTRRIEFMGHRVSNEDIKIWDDNIYSCSKTYFISKKDYALLHFVEHRKQTLSNDTSYTDFITSTFVKEGKYYVLEHLLQEADRYHPRMGIFARNDLSTLTYIDRPSVQKSMDEAHIQYDSKGLFN